MSRGRPSMVALLGLLAVAGYQNRAKIAEWLGGLKQQPGGAPGSNEVQANPGGVLGNLGGLLGGASVGSVLSGGLRDLVERFKRVDPAAIEYTVTVDDPTTFTRAWTAMIPITKLPDDTQIYEYACHEGNYAMPNLLRGGRTDAARTSSR